MPAAAISGDMTACPRFAIRSFTEEGSPHVGGPLEKIQPPTMPVGSGDPAIVLGDIARCETGDIDVVVSGSATVLLGGLPVAREGDAMSHSGLIIEGSGTVDIGGPSFSLPIASYLGEPEVISEFVRTAFLSPTLQAQLDDLAAEGWNILFGRPGGGSYANRGTATIVIDPDQSANGLLHALAHEAGHAGYDLPPVIPMEGLTREEFIELNAERNYRDEAIAELNDMMIRTEVEAAGGPPQTYDPIYERYLAGEITYEEAVDLLVADWPTRETSTTGETYEEFYEGYYEEWWDDTH